MDFEIKRALKGSIDKWINIALGVKENKGAANCPLCLLFNDECSFECPVCKSVDNYGCIHTPYNEYCAFAFHKICYRNTKGYKIIAKNLALKEVRFLESLLEEDKQKV